jgi:glycosyltransferase involved in cell wall biosynthesis
MKVWLLKTGEELPIDHKCPRLYRMGLLADYMVKKGHDVTWWTANFDHFHRYHRNTEDKVIEISKNYRINLLSSCGYSNNVSFKRLVDHHQLASKFKKQSVNHEPPDIILCSMPTIEWSDVAVQYANKHNVPVVLDLRDLWPDIFIRAFPKFFRPFSKVFMWPYYTKLKRSIRNATAITGITQQVLDWGLALADRKPTIRDKPFYLAYQEKQYEESDEVIAFWKNHGVGPGFNKKIISFVGSISRQFDFETVIETAKRLEKETDYYFVMCGSGDRLESMKQKAADCRNVVFPGRINGTQIHHLLKQTYLGLAPYMPTDDFLMSLPNKIGEYMSAGLPVISGVDGVIGNLLNENHCGMVYEFQNSQNLYKTLIDLYHKPQQVAEMSQHAISTFQSELNAQNVYPNMIQWLELIANEHQVSLHDN